MARERWQQLSERGRRRRRGGGRRGTRYRRPLRRRDLRGPMPRRSRAGDRRGTRPCRRRRRLGRRRLGCRRLCRCLRRRRGLPTPESSRRTSCCPFSSRPRGSRRRNRISYASCRPSPPRLRLEREREKKSWRERRGRGGELKRERGRGNRASAVSEAMLLRGRRCPRGESNKAMEGVREEKNESDGNWSGAHAASTYCFPCSFSIPDGRQTLPSRPSWSRARVRKRERETAACSFSRGKNTGRGERSRWRARARKNELSNARCFAGGTISLPEISRRIRERTQGWKCRGSADNFRAKLQRQREERERKRRMQFALARRASMLQSRPPRAGARPLFTYQYIPQGHRGDRCECRAEG